MDAVSDPNPGDEHIGGRLGPPRGPRPGGLGGASTDCHTESLPAYRFTKDQYQSIVYHMAERGAQASSAELDQIAEYLAKNFPKVEDPAQVNVTKATANEIEARLGIMAREADAIVAYRERHGDFRAIGDLYVLYGVGGTKIEAAKDKISF